MSNSALVNVVIPSPNYSKRTKPITKITVHHMAGNLSVEQCGNIFKPATRKGSSNYGIGSDGRVGLYVDESNRAWTSGNAENDQMAVTIEVANNSGAPNWTVSDKAYAKLVDLCVDICKRNGIKFVNWTGNKNGNLTCHYFFQATACPGPYLKSKMGDLAKQINARLSGAAAEEPKAPAPITPPFPYLVKIMTDVLNVRSGVGTQNKITTTVRRGQVYTIVDEVSGWGKLKSGAGWICLAYTIKV